MNNFFNKLNKFVNNKKKMEMVNIQKVFIGPFIGNDTSTVISTGFKKIFDGQLKCTTTTKEFQVSNPIKQVLEAQRIIKYYDYTLKNDADSFVAEFVAEPLNKQTKEAVSISAMGLDFKLKDPNNDIVDLTEHHFKTFQQKTGGFKPPVFYQSYINYNL